MKRMFVWLRALWLDLARWRLARKGIPFMGGAGAFVMKDAVITVAGTDISDHVSSVSLEDTAEEVDVTAFTPSQYKQFLQGMKDATITAEVFNDFAAASIDAVLQPLYTSGGTFDVVVRAAAAAVSSTNPKYTLTSRLYGYSPLGGAVGEAASTEITFRNAGTAGLVRGTS